MTGWFIRNFKQSIQNRYPKLKFPHQKKHKLKSKKKKRARFEIDLSCLIQNKSVIVIEIIIKKGMLTRILEGTLPFESRRHLNHHSQYWQSIIITTLIKC